MANLVKSGDFTHNLFGSLTTIKNENNEVFFLAKQISDFLEYSDSAQLTRRLDEDETIKLDYENAKLILTQDENIHSSGVILLTEAGLYSAILGSKKQEAKAFKKWVVGEVLPAIRKTGGYSVSKTEEDTILDLFPTTDVNLVKLVANTIRENKEQKRLLIEQKPKVEFYDEIIDAKETFDFSAVAKLMKLKYGRNTLFNKLRGAKVLMSDNEPYQQYMGTYFMIVEAKWNNPKTGSSHAVKQTRVTQRGIEWLTKNKEKFNL